jgi:hypothetical protein
MVGSEELALSATIRKTLDAAEEARWEYAQDYPTTLEEAEDADDGKRDKFRFLMEKAFRDTCMLAERLGLGFLREQLQSEFRKFDDIAELSPPLYDVIQESIPLQIVRDVYLSMATITDSGEITGLKVFRTILENTGAIIARRGLVPESERDVRDAIFEVMGFAFHDAVRDVPIAQVTRIYKPDLGVPSLMAAAEYKYVINQSELRKSLGGFYEDMKGYTNPQWRTFFAVLYTTEPLLHQKRLEAEFSGVKADTNWIPIVVTGPGTGAGGIDG